MTTFGPTARLLSGIALMAIAVIGSGCQPVPLADREIQQQEQPPVKPLYDKPLQGKQVHDGRKSQSGFELASTSDASKPQPTKAQQDAKAKSNVDVSRQLVDAADKAGSARSLAQSAQTKDDWNLVFAQWKRALKILKDAPAQTPQIKQKIAEYNQGLVQATRDAKVSLNPSLAPVDPTGSQAIKTLIGVQENKPKQPAQNGQPKAAKPSPNPTAKPAEKTTPAPAQPDSAQPPANQPAAQPADASN